MHWTAILTALVLSLISAYLALIQGWTLTHVFLVVCGSAFLLIPALIGILLVLAGREERPELMRLVITTLRNDFDDMLRWLRVKQRK